jgi:SAM-dependent methyltransferase
VLEWAVMQQFYEDFWADAPEDEEPYAWTQRRGLLQAELHPGDRVLDYGCGSGRFLALLDDAAGVEIAEAAVERARANAPHADVRLLEGDGTIPFGHGEFDLVWCSEVLEHIPDVGFALSEIRRVLKPSGRLLLTVPFHGRVRTAWIALTRFEEHFDPLGQHVRFFTRRSLTEALDVAGFGPAVRRDGELLVARAERR